MILKTLRLMLSLLTKIMQKHFSAGSKGNPQETSVQKAFEKEVGKRVAQQRSAGKWEEH